MGVVRLLFVLSGVLFAAALAWLWNYEPTQPALADDGYWGPGQR